MRKILVMAAVFVLAATTSFAAGGTGTSGAITFATDGKSLHGAPATATATTARIGKCSTGVDVAWQTSAVAYAMMTQHKSGTKAYGSSYDSTAIYQTIVDVAPGTAAYGAGGALTASDTTDFSDTAKWKAM